MTDKNENNSRDFGGIKVKKWKHKPERQLFLVLFIKWDTFFNSDKSVLIMWS